MTQREAQREAGAQMLRHCANRCGAIKIVKAQRMKEGWLVDFDAPAARYAVFVHDNSATDISVWSKSAGATR